MRGVVFQIGLCAFLALALLENVAIAQQSNFKVCEDGSGDAAIAACSNVIATGEYTGAQLATIYFRRGAANHTKKNYDQAIADFSTAIRLDSSSYRYYIWRGNTYSQKNNYDLAISDYDTQVKLNPDRADALHVRGEFFTGFAKYDLAFADLNESLRLRPDDAPTLDGRGRAYLLTKQFDEAIRDFDAAVRLRGFINSLYARGWARLQIGDIVRANEDIAKAKAALPDVAEKYGKYYGIEAAYPYAIWSHIHAHPFSYPADLTERGAEVRARVTFSIDRDGKLVDAKMAIGSGSAKADQEILDWLTRLQPFPRVPANLTPPFEFSEEIVFVPPNVLSEVKIKWIIDASASANEAGFRDLVASHLRRQPRSYSDEMNSGHGTRRAVVTLLINQDGKLLNVEMTKGSGSPKVDQETLVWLKAAQPYPQVPMNFTAPLKLIAEIGFGPPSKGIWSDEKIKRAINNVCKGC